MFDITKAAIPLTAACGLLVGLAPGIYLYGRADERLANHMASHAKWEAQHETESKEDRATLHRHETALQLQNQQQVQILTSINELKQKLDNATVVVNARGQR